MIDKTHAANIASMLAQIRQYEVRASGSVDALDPAQAADAPGPAESSFAGAVKQAMESVNKLQKNADAKASAFESGEDVPLTDVVLAMQKASIAFEATLQIRNKVMKAYEDVRNMPI